MSKVAMSANVAIHAGAPALQGGQSSAGASGGAAASSNSSSSSSATVHLVIHDDFNTPVSRPTLGTGIRLQRPGISKTQHLQAILAYIEPAIEVVGNRGCAGSRQVPIGIELLTEGDGNIIGVAFDVDTTRSDGNTLTHPRQQR